ncbi:MAG: hypothetical protein H6933_02585 [Burkholderiaceae bacterium]|nr:hypothetical protein [Burkholderiaceae bacterium]
MHRTAQLLLAALALSACANPFFDVGRSETVLPVSRAWVEGRMVEYITTDASDRAMAGMMGVNFAPRLARAATQVPGASVLERVYKFEDESQISVFQSSPSPVGPDSADKAYSPLWRVVLVRWLDSSKARELKSEEQVLAAEEANEVKLEITDIVINCPVTREVGGAGIRGVR